MRSTAAHKRAKKILPDIKASSIDNSIEFDLRLTDFPEHAVDIIGNADLSEYDGSSMFVQGVEALRQFKWPLYGWTIRRMENIPIDRNNIHASIKSMEKTDLSTEELRDYISEKIQDLIE